MLLRNSHQRWFAAAVCVIASAGHAVAQEGVVKLSANTNRPGVVRLASASASAEAEPQQQQKQRITAPAYFAPNAGYAAAWHNPQMGSAMQGYYAQQQAYAQQMYAQQAAFAQQVGYDPQMQHASYGMPAHRMQAGPHGYGAAGMVSMNQSVQPTSFSQSLYSTDGCGIDGCGTDGCGCGPACGCGAEGGCGEDGCNSGYCSDGSGRRGRRTGRNPGNSCDSYSYGPGHRERMVTLFARATPDDGCTRWGTRWWRGQQHNYLARNQRLSNTLFGWLVPSGCCGQGCPPVGGYHMVYADDPGYADPRDGGQLYGAQGYGTHLSVPLAPNVRHSYNYSWGTPSSRITPMGQYHPGGGFAQQSPYQTW